MALKRITIDGIANGRADTKYMPKSGQFTASIAIDPDLPVGDSVLTSGMAVPTSFKSFSSSAMTSYVIQWITSPKNALIYAVLKNGSLLSYTAALGSETLVATVAGGNAEGAAYYNNYIYIFGTGSSKNDVSRYGPLDNSPSLTDAVWTGSTLGSQTALTATTYPQFNNATLPNHWAFAHSDGNLYFVDYINGQGLVHKIATTKGTNEGDTNNGSAYNVLDLNYGFYPTSICNFGTDIAVIAIQSTSAAINQGQAALFLWDPTNTVTFYRQIALPDPMATALTYADGYLTIWSGNAGAGVRLTQYTGNGDTVSDLVSLEDGQPPLAGAVDNIESGVVWGQQITYPSLAAVVFAYGYDGGDLSSGLQCISRANDVSIVNPNITALMLALQSARASNQLIQAWADTGTFAADSYGSTTLASVLNLPMAMIGQRFNIKKIRIPFGGAVDSNTTITPKIYFDDESLTLTLATINNTNYPAQRKVLYKQPQIVGNTTQNNFFLQLVWTGTTALPLLFPILIDIETFEDETNQ